MLTWSDNRTFFIDSHPFKAALFDLDGVILDTEDQYTAFWTQIGQKYFPDNPQFPYDIKGRTLDEISLLYFSDIPEALAEVKNLLAVHQQTIDYRYISGAPEFIRLLCEHNIPRAIVTSSSPAKMACVFAARPELIQWFPTIISAERITRSKPQPDCYLLAAKELAIAPCDCLVFEDSLTGLTAARRAAMGVFGLATTLAQEQVRPLCDWVIRDFKQIL